MTVEEYIARESSNVFNKINPSDVVFLGFEASPSKIWSENTIEDFSAKMLYDLRSTPAKKHNREFWYIYLDEDDVCNFLNEMFPTQVRQ